MQNSFLILTVCTGNICRSPLAEHLLSTLLQDIPEITVASAGTLALTDEPMDPSTRDIARAHGAINVAGHRARRLTQEMVEEADLILGMSRSHRRAVVELSPRSARRTFTLKEFARLAEATDYETIPKEYPEYATPAGRMSAAVRAVPSSRSLLPPPVTPDEDDILDPYRQP